MKRAVTTILVMGISLFAVLIPLLAYTLVWIITTNTGTQFAWKSAQPFLPETVQIHSLNGRFIGPINLRGVTVKTEAFILELDRIELEWKPSTLFRRMVDIESIALEGLRYTQLATAPAKSKEEQTPIALPEKIAFPLDVRLGKISLRDFKFYSTPATEPFVINLATLTASAKKHRIDITNIKVESPIFAVEGKTSLTTNQDYLLDGELYWRVPVPAYPAAQGHTVINGSLRQLTIKQNIAKPYDIQAVVLLKDPLNTLTFEATMSVNPLKLSTLNKDLPPMTVQLGVTAKGNPNDLAFTLNGWLEDPHFGRFNSVLAGGLKAQTINIEELKITIPEQPAQLEARGQIEMADELALNLMLDWQQLQWPLTGTPLIKSPHGTMKLTGTPENLQTKLDISVGDRGKIEGKAERKNELIDIALDWHDLQWPLLKPEIQSSIGHIAVAGTIDDYSLDMQADVIVPGKTDAHLQLEGRGSQEALDLSRIDIAALEGKIKGKAKIAWIPELKTDVDLVGQGLNPGVILKEWSGKLDIALRAQSGMKNKQTRLHLQHLTAQGQLRGYDLALDAAGEYDEHLTVIKHLLLSSGSTELEAVGTISDTLDVKWKIHSENLGTLLPKAEGRIDGKGTLAGTAERPQVATELIAEELVYSEYRLKSLNLSANVDLTGKKQSTVLLVLQEGHAAGIELKDIALSGQGDPDSHTFTLTADTSRGQADIALIGQLQNPWQQDMIWNFQLEQGKLKFPNLDSWALQAPSTGSIAAGQAQLSKSCWQSAETLLCLTGQQSPQGTQAGFQLTDLPLSYFAHYLPSEINVQGSLNGNGTFNQSGKEAPHANIDLKTTQVRLQPSDSSEKHQQSAPIIEFLPGEISLKMQQDTLQAKMKLPISKTDGIDFQATILPGQSPPIERQLQGQLTAEVQNLAFISDLTPEIQELTGKLQGKMELSGSLKSPVLSGRLALIEGGAKLERPGLDLKDIQVELTGDGDGGVQLTAHALSEEGELNIDGIAKLLGEATKADIKVKGKNFRLMNTFEAQVDVSPDLTIALNEKSIDVGGEVLIPKANIKLKALPESAVKVSSDQVIIKSEPQAKAGKVDKTPNREMNARVRIVLGDDVHFEGFGLKARIEGKVLAIEKPGEPTTGSGELMLLDGEYRAYGQGLVVEKGHIFFAGGPIDQPGLDVRAIRRPAKNITVGVQVRGNLRHPDFKLFSDPVMTQGNQLSYLVLGRPMSGTSGNEGSVLSRAALAIGLKGGNSVAEKIGSTLGLDQFGIDSGEAGSGTNTEQASFVVGKYLSPKLYVSYGLGLFDPVSTLRLQYAISSRWEFVTQSSGVATGGDIIYTIETGK